ncbi:oxygen-independent coproporphyrinogen III oxidase [Sphingomonas pseudosanguinis]|uniref:Coproporphyrinogen-III oxidase n=1 Tax=Sphingomonas pseudosanguinis TaxID=413712 RepID=A0A7W6AEH1_9SPHN|nr:oxygen-independent coproporphyrinogen III oxidase [Sphingomonas pseudosanguinis]MBB3880674.1 oxygen-independent coproporphyrinogen-3 oxidase [Sphingomonas pseudosanguinis]MBN3535146.1 oxygen-independent coproporphyrinogen III oxidase [Sphingomonas pseudosanguinis]
MWPYHPELLARPVPRYTSYPTAAEFGDGVGHDDMSAALDAVDADADVSLYLHIPYCRAICWYCGCNTGAANRTTRLEKYLTRLHAEIDRIAARLEGRGQIRRIAFGGGSPNAISPGAFAALVAHLRSAFACDDAPLSLEIDPRGFASDWASVIAATGVARVSLGVQTFDPMLQAAIGRVQPCEDIVRAVALLREAGVGSINFDLMYGLPGQTDAALRATLEATIALAPERLAVFGYAHVPHLILRQRRIDATALPGTAARFAQAAAAHERLTAAGYRAVGFDHFAKPDDPLAQAAAKGTLRRNFQGFTDDPADILIGLGASAISGFPDRLLQNAKKAGDWHQAIGAGRFATTRGIRRTPLDRRRGAAIAGVLCQGVADTDGLPERDAIRARLSRFEQAGLLGWDGHRLRLTADALPYARSIAAAFDAWRSEGDTRFSRAV